MILWPLFENKSINLINKHMGGDTLFHLRYLGHCDESLSKTHLSSLSTGSTREDPSQHN